MRLFSCLLAVRAVDLFCTVDSTERHCILSQRTLYAYMLQINLFNPLITQSIKLGNLNLKSIVLTTAFITFSVLLNIAKQCHVIYYFSTLKQQILVGPLQKNAD